MTTQTPGHLITTARYATLPDLVGILRTQRARQLDVVARPGAINLRGGLLQVDGTEAVIDESGVTDAAGTFRPMATFDYGVSEKLGVPRKWLTQQRENRPDIYDEVVNRLLHGGTDAAGGSYPPSDKKFLLRLFRGDPGDPGIARAMVSDAYRPIDNLDVVMTVLDVLNKARDDGQLPEGGAEVRNLNLTEDTMHLRITVPGIAAHAPVLTRDYRDPFRDGGAYRAAGWQNPGAPRPKEGDVVWAGLDVTNNEVGFGGLYITPMFVVCICDNGQVLPHKALKQVHAGVRLEEGEIDWSEETRNKAAELVVLKTRDAIGKFLSVKGLESLVAEVEGRAAEPVTDGAETIKVVAKKCGWSEEAQDAILRHFILGGQPTSGGIANAVTSAAQEMADPADALDLEYKALTAMAAAADHAKATAKAG